MDILLVLANINKELLH